uniref:Uncharacterized protein n=1 Tax=Ralstonia syzygii R24 TaxID=907261 RepID=G3ABA0_9RALS|nr:conserved hypothetical protein [Ralstonia syzygii R24]
MGDKTFQGTRKRTLVPRGDAAGAGQAAPAARVRIVPHIFFHPDSDRRPRHLTGSADPGMRNACRALAGSQDHGPHTAGGEFHPALKTYQAGKSAGSRDATPAARHASPLLTGRINRLPGGTFGAGTAGSGGIRCSRTLSGLRRSAVHPPFIFASGPFHSMPGLPFMLGFNNRPVPLAQYIAGKTNRPTQYEGKLR